MAISYRDPRTGQTRSANSWDDVERAVRGATRSTPSEDLDRDPGAAGGQTGTAGPGRSSDNQRAREQTAAGRGGGDDRGSERGGAKGTPKVGDTITVKGQTIVVTQVDTRRGMVSGVNQQGGLSQFNAADLQRSGYAPPTEVEAGTGLPATPGTAGTSTGVPVPTPGQTDAPLDPTDFLETLGLGDTASSFVLNQFGAGAGAAPFQNRLEQLADAQVFPFLVQQAMGLGGNELTAEDFTARQFQDYLGQSFGQPTHGGSFGVGQSLRQAADFLREPGMGDVLSPAQNFLQSQLQREGLTGASGFAPTIGLVGSQALGAAPGIRSQLASAYQRSIRNLLNQDPTRFTNAPDLIDFLGQQGVIR